MNSIVRNFVVPACVVALGAAAIVWNLERVGTTERKFAEEAQKYQSGADRGDANSEYELGRMYRWGQGVPQDYALARYWYQKAADQGLAKAKYAIGNLYYYGNGVQQSYPVALVWYRQAAGQGDPTAEHELGVMSYYGDGVPQSYSEALVYFRKAADLGDPKSEYDIGYQYARGLGVPMNNAEANRWYRKAAGQGDRYAQEALGLRLRPLRRSVWTVQAVLLLGCLLLTWDGVAPRHFLRDRKNRELAVGGALVSLNIGMYLFSHSEYCLFPSARATAEFQIANFFLGGVAVSMLVVSLWPGAAKALLVVSALLALAMDVSLCAVARFNPQIIYASISRFVAANALPLGAAITAAIHSWRRKPEPGDGVSEPPAEGGEDADAV